MSREYLQVEIMTGSESRNGKSAKVHAFLVPCKDTMSGEDTSDLNETHVGKSRGWPTVGEMHHNWVPAFLGGARLELGRWNTGVYAFREGTILKVFGFSSMGWNVPKKMANVYIQIRHGAAFNELSMPLTQEAEYSFRDATIRGRFDILDEGLLESEGVSNYRYEELSMTPFNLKRIHPMKNARNRSTTRTIQGMDGEEIKIVENKPKRRLGF
jgi:hypothetical protein